MAAADALGVQSALVVANPVAARGSSTPTSTSACWPRGSSAPRAAGITGKAVTPFLLDHLHRATDGRSLEVNIARRARQRRGGRRDRGGLGGALVILVVGDVMDDLIVRPLGPLMPRSDTPAHMERHPGGSGANTAAWLGALGAEVRFAGRVGAADLRRHARALETCGVDARLAA